jgi:hypothetical protein
MLPFKKTRVYIEMEVECKLASQEKNPKKEVPVINSKIPKKNPSNHDTKKVLMIVKFTIKSKGRIFRHEPKIICFIGHITTQPPM